MFKFIKQYAETIKGIDVYPIFSMILFIAFFAGVLWFVKRMSRETVSELSALPLEDHNPVLHS